MKDEIVKLIIDRTIKENSMCDVEKSDFLKYFSWIFKEEMSEEDNDRITELMDKWD